jgi:hypothetical protein
VNLPISDIPLPNDGEAGEIPRAGPQAAAILRERAAEQGEPGVHEVDFFWIHHPFPRRKIEFLKSDQEEGLLEIVYLDKQFLAKLFTLSRENKQYFGLSSLDELDVRFYKMKRYCNKVRRRFLYI